MSSETSESKANSAATSAAPASTPRQRSASQPTSKPITLAEVDLDDDRYLGRVKRNDRAIAEYQQRTLDELIRPEDPIILVWDKESGKYIIIAGHHRLLALAKKKVNSVEALVYDDISPADALTLSAQSNQHHGMKLTNADKKRLCEDYLLAKADEELYPTDKSVADLLSISPPSVKRYRQELEQAGKLKVVDTRVASDGAKSPTPKASVKPKVENLKAILRQARDRASQLKDADWAELDEAEREGSGVTLAKYAEALNVAISEMTMASRPLPDGQTAAAAS
jgi:hypothetical protein